MIGAIQFLLAVLLTMPSSAAFGQMRDKRVSPEELYNRSNPTLRRIMPLNSKLSAYLPDASNHFDYKYKTPYSCSRYERRGRLESPTGYLRRTLSLPVKISFFCVFKQVRPEKIKALAGEHLMEAEYLALMISPKQIVDICASDARRQMRKLGDRGLGVANVSAGSIAYTCGDYKETLQRYTSALESGQEYLRREVEDMSQPVISNSPSQPFSYKTTTPSRTEQP